MPRSRCAPRPPTLDAHAETTPSITTNYSCRNWIGIGDKSPLFMSPFGDVFFRAHDGFWYLDPPEAALIWPWVTADELKAALNGALPPQVW